MRPTKKMLALAGFGIVLVALGALVYQHKLVFFLYYGGLIGISFWDFVKSKPTFQVTRCHEHQLSLFATEEMTLEVYNQSDKVLHIWIKDHLPDFHFERKTLQATGVIKPHEKGLVSYEIVPKRRGIYTFERLYVGYLSQMNLMTKYMTLEQAAEIRVYPNMKDLKKYRLMVYSGYEVRGSKRVWHKRGESLEFDSLREYVQGDDYRRINWRATATSNKPIVNQYIVEKNQDIIALIDTGRAMSYEVRGYKKLDLAINTALILSDIANMSGDKSGLMAFNTQVQAYVKPGSGAGHRHQLMENLFTIQYNRETSNFQTAFMALNQFHKKSSILFVFTDFETMDEATEYLNVLPLISRRHLVLLFMMTKEKVVTLTQDISGGDEALFLKGTAIELLSERQKIIQTLRRQGIMCMECTPETLTTEVINHYIRLKQTHGGN